MKSLLKTRNRMHLQIAALLILPQLVQLYAHEHMPAGATASTPGATRQYAPSAQDFTTNSKWVFGLNVGTTNDAYFGYYWTDDSVFTALSATPNNGGPEPGHAAPGTYIQVKLLSVDGPAGASFGFWETAGQGADGEGVGANILIAAPSFLPDNAGPGTAPATYTLLSASAVYGPWQPLVDPIVGDDLMHTINVASMASAQFFRLSAKYPGSN
jgi:hypothetical protein